MKQVKVVLLCCVIIVSISAFRIDTFNIKRAIHKCKLASKSSEPALLKEQVAELTAGIKDFQSEAYKQLYNKQLQWATKLNSSKNKTQAFNEERVESSSLTEVASESQSMPTIPAETAGADSSSSTDDIQASNAFELASSAKEEKTGGLVPGVAKMVPRNQKSGVNLQTQLAAAAAAAKEKLRIAMQSITGNLTVITLPKLDTSAFSKALSFMSPSPGFDQPVAVQRSPSNSDRPAPVITTAVAPNAPSKQEEEKVGPAVAMKQRVGPPPAPVVSAPSAVTTRSVAEQGKETSIGPAVATKRLGEGRGVAKTPTSAVNPTVKPVSKPVDIGRLFAFGGPRQVAKKTLPTARAAPAAAPAALRPNEDSTEGGGGDLMAAFERFMMGPGSPLESEATSPYLPAAQPAGQVQPTVGTPRQQPVLNRPASAVRATTKSSTGTPATSKPAPVGAGLSSLPAFFGALLGRNAANSSPRRAAQPQTTKNAADVPARTAAVPRIDETAKAKPPVKASVQPPSVAAVTLKLPSLFSSLTVKKPSVKRGMNAKFVAMVDRVLKGDAAKMRAFQQATDSLRAGDLRPQAYLAKLQKLFGADLLGTIVPPLLAELPERAIAGELKAAYEGLRTQVVNTKAGTAGMGTIWQMFSPKPSAAKPVATALSASAAPRSTAGKLSVLSQPPPLAPVARSIAVAAPARAATATTSGAGGVPDQVPIAKKAFVAAQLTALKAGGADAKTAYSALVRELGAVKVGAILPELVRMLPVGVGAKLSAAAADGLKSKK